VVHQRADDAGAHTVSDTAHAYLAFRAALLAVRRHNANDALEPVRTVMCPGLGTGIGLMPPDGYARQMRTAWDEFVSGTRFPTSIAAAESAHDLLVR
jgi:O-acetyl-ADP-ribose deacetylase (regulator of RNase III)